MKSLYFEHGVSAFVHNISLRILHHSTVVYLCFLNTANSLFPSHNLAHFGIPYLCPVHQVIKTFRRDQIVAFHGPHIHSYSNSFTLW